MPESSSQPRLPAHGALAVVFQVREEMLQVLLWERGRDPYRGAWSLPGGTLVKGRIVGLMHMTDTGDLDSKVVVSPVDEKHALDPDLRARLEQFFNTYKNHEGKVTKITGWASQADALAFLQQTASFFGRRS